MEFVDFQLGLNVYLFFADANPLFKFLSGEILSCLTSPCSTSTCSTSP